MGCTLIIGRDEDLCCRLVGERLNSLGREILYLPEDRLFPGLRIAWQLNNGSSRGTLGFESRDVHFSEIDGVLARFYGIATTPEEFQTKDGQYLCSEWHALMRGYIQELTCPVVNRLQPQLWYKSSLQVHELLSLVPLLSFPLPKSTITTKFEDARVFFEFCGRRMQYSPLTMRSRYTIETEDDLRKLEALSKILPLYLTEMVSGDVADAYVTGDDVVFDGASNDGVSKKCKEIAALLGLTFCQFRFIRTDGDEWYLEGLECMPYLFDCTDETRNVVIERIANILCSGIGRKLA
jgi:hypothetical protein